MRNHLFETIENYNIPEPLSRWFNWLSMGDISVQQQLRSHFLNIEKEQVFKQTPVQLPVTLKHINQSGDNIHRRNQQIEIGKHKIDLTFDTKATDITLEDPRTYRPTSTNGDWTRLW